MIEYSTITYLYILFAIIILKFRSDFFNSPKFLKRQMKARVSEDGMEYFRGISRVQKEDLSIYLSVASVN